MRFLRLVFLIFKFIKDPLHCRVPQFQLFYCTSFALNTIEYFEAVFLEPRIHEADRLVSDMERSRLAAKSQQSGNTKIAPSATTLHRPESSGSLASIVSQQTPVAAAQSRFFRPYQALLNRLEYYHDTVGVLLNFRLESKSEEFWKTVNSYSVLHGELKDSIEAASAARKYLAQIRETVYERTKKCVEVYYAKENRLRLLHKLKAGMGLGNWTHSSIKQINNSRISPVSAMPVPQCRCSSTRTTSPRPWSA